MTVSVVIPTYNHRDFILRTLQSVVAQSFTDYEVIVVNDGSPDDTHDLLMPLADAGRIRYFRQANAGQASARNRGIETARGRYIALLDDDDLWPMGSLAERVRLMEQHPDAVLVYGRVEPIDGADAPLTAEAREQLAIEIPPDGPNGDVFAAFVERNYILSPGQTLIRRSALDALEESPFDTTLWGVDDFDLYLRLASLGPFAYTPITVLHYRIHAGNASRNAARMHRNEMALYRKHLRRFAGDPQKRQSIRRGWQQRRNRLTRYWLRTAFVAMCRGRFAEAGENLLTTMQLHAL